MSRFYDALREASRSSPEASLPPKADEPAAPDASLQVVPTTIAEIAEAEIRRAEAIRPSAETQPPTEPWQMAARPSGEQRAEELLDFLESPLHNGHEHTAALGRQTEIAIDPRIRLIPNASDSVVVECYRRLRTKILQQQAVRAFRTVVVTSPGPKEGKTVTTLNLAFSFAMLPAFRVLVVDGDLRRGTIGQWLGVSDRAGLSDWIEGSARLEDVVLKSETPSLHFIVRGKSKLAPGELLHSPQLGNHFRQLMDRFDLVLVDSPPVNLISDVQLLARSCEAVLLVGRAFSTTRTALEQAVQELSPYRIIGSILNGGVRGQSYRHYGEY